jgi:hypothetical protein
LPKKVKRGRKKLANMRIMFRYAPINLQSAHPIWMNGVGGGGRVILERGTI